MRRFPAPCITLLLFVISATVDAQMVWDRALTLTGVHPSYAVVSPASALNPRTALTMECWIDPANAASPTDQVLLSKTQSSDGYQLFLRSGNVCLALNGLVVCRSVGVVPSGGWTHIAATFDSATGIAAVYLNGALDTSTTGNKHGITTSTDSLFIGRAGYSIAALFAGSLDDIRVWDHALTSAEIQRYFRSIIKTHTGVYAGLLLSMPMQLEYGYGGTIADYSGNGNIVALRGSTSWLDMRDTPSMTTCPNESVYFDGSGYLVTPWNGYNNISGSYTLEAWVWPSVTQLSTILQKRQSANNAGYTLYLSNNKPCVRTNSSTYLVSSKAIPNNQWSHIAATYDSSTGIYCLYVNGVFDTSSTFTGTNPTASTDSLYIGNGFNGAFRGYLDEVRIANYAKTAAEIKKFTFCSIDNNNEPNSGKTNIVYSFDGTLMDVADVSAWLTFHGSARFSHPGGFADVPVSPLLRDDEIGYPGGFWMKPSMRKVPASGTQGLMVDDTLSISQSVSITSLRLAVMINHTAESDLRITLIGPGGDSVDVDTREGLAGSADNVMTIFDDAAAKDITGGPFISWTPLIKPAGSLNTAFAGKMSNGVWRLRVRDEAALDSGWVNGWGLQFNNSSLVNVSEKPAVAQQYRLEQNYPNPFNPTTRISFSIGGAAAPSGAEGPASTNVRLAIYDLLGREVAVLADSRYPAGNYTFTFDGTRLSSGVYFCRLTAGSFAAVRKMTLLK